MTMLVFCGLSELIYLKDEEDVIKKWCVTCAVMGTAQGALRTGAGYRTRM